MSEQTYMGGAIVDENELFIFAQIDELNEQGIDHTKVLRWRGGDWAYYMVDWPVISLCVTDHPEFSVLALGLNGEVHVAQGGSMHTEQIDDTPAGPDARGVMREIRTIAGVPYAVGMQRQAYRRIQGVWSRFDDEIVLPQGSGDIRSIDSIHGFLGGDIYAAGLFGEVWKHNGEKWAAIDSPTSVAFEKVLCAPNGLVYIAGHSGTIIVGKDSQWDVLHDGDIDGTIWDLAWFKGDLYAATRRGLFVLEDGAMRALDIGLGESWSYGNLVANDDVLWSLGRKHLSRTSDGEDWEEVPCDHTHY